MPAEPSRRLQPIVVHIRMAACARQLRMQDDSQSPCVGRLCTTPWIEDLDETSGS